MKIQEVMNMPENIWKDIIIYFRVMDIRHMITLMISGIWAAGHIVVENIQKH